MTQKAERTIDDPLKNRDAIRRTFFKWVSYVAGFFAVLGLAVFIGVYWYSKPNKPQENTKQQPTPPAQQKEPFQGPNPANQRVIELPSASSGGSRSIPLGSDLEEGPANATLSYGGAGIVQTVRTYNLTIPPLPSEKKEEEKITTNTQPPPPSVDDPSKWTQWVTHNDRYGYNLDYPGKKSDVLLYVQFKYSTGGYSEVFLDGSGKVMRLEASVTAVRFSNPSSNPPVIVVCKLVDP